MIDNDQLMQLSTKLSECDWSDCGNNDTNIAFQSVNTKISALYNNYLTMNMMKTIKVKYLETKKNLGCPTVFLSRLNQK